jgi:hypothetical protein
VVKLKVSHLKTPQQNAFHEIAKLLALLVIITPNMSLRLFEYFNEQIFQFKKFRITRTMECERNSGVVLMRSFIILCLRHRKNQSRLGSN